MQLTRNEKQRLRTSKSARRKKQMTHNFQLHETNQFRPRPITQLENISVIMNRRPERNMRFHYKSRNWNSFDDGKFYRRKWSELDDIWKPNFDYDDFDEGVTSRSANTHVQNQQFNHYNNRYRQPFPNYRNDKQETHLKRECNLKNNNNSVKNIPKVSANEKTINKEVRPQSSIQNSTNTNCKYQKGLEVKKETKYTDTVIKDTIDEELQLIHGGEVNKDCETSAKHFNINTRLSYLENYPVKTSELNQTQKQICDSVSAKSATEDKINKDFKPVETNTRINTVMDKNIDKAKPHELALKRDGDEHKTNNNTKFNHMVVDTHIKTGQGFDTNLHNVLKILVPTNVGATTCKQEKDKLVKVLGEDVKKQKFSKLTMKTNSCKMKEQPSLPELIEKSDESTKISLENSSINTLKLSKDTKKIYGKDEAETKEFFRKRKYNVDSCPIILKNALISGRRNTVTVASESDTNSAKVLVFKTMEEKRTVGTGNVTNQKLNLDSNNVIDKHAKISKRRMTVSVPLEPVVSLFEVSKTVTDQSTIANVSLIKQKLNLNSNNTITKNPKISKRRKTISSPLETDIDSVEVSKTLGNKSLFGGIDVLKDKLISNSTNSITKCGSISKRRKTLAVSSDADSDLTKTTTNKMTGLSAMRKKRSTSVDSIVGTVSRITRSKSKELKCADIKGASSKQSNCNQNVSSNSDKKDNTPVEIIKSVSKVGRPRKIPHTPKEENMPDPRLRKPDECRTISQKLKNSKIHSKNNFASDKIRNDRNKFISKDTLDFLFGEKPKLNKKQMNRPLSKEKPATKWNLKRLDPPSTNSKPTSTSWNLNELDVSNEQLNIFFKVNNAPEEFQSYEPETTSNLDELDYSQLLVKATETMQISITETVNSSYVPEVLTDQTVATQMTKSSIEQIIQGQKQLVCNVKNIGGVLIPNWTTNACSPNHPQPNQQQTSESLPTQSVSTSDTIDSKSAYKLINKNSITHEVFMKEFYFFIFMYSDTHQALLSRIKLFTDYSIPEQQIWVEVQDFAKCFSDKMRRFTESICKYFGTRFIPSFSCKALMWHFEDQYRKHTGQSPKMLHILNFFHCVVKDIKKTREPSGFLEEFCVDIENTHAYFISNRNVQTQHNSQNQQRLQNPQNQPRQQRQISQNAPVPQQPQQILQRQRQHTQQPLLPQRVAYVQSQHQMSQKLPQTPRLPYVQHSASVRLPPPSYNQSLQTQKLPASPQYSESQHIRRLRQLVQSGMTPHPQGRPETTEVNETTINNRLSLTAEQRNLFELQCTTYNLLIRKYYFLLSSSMSPSVLNTSSTEVSSTNRSIYSNLPTESTGLLSNLLQRTTVDNPTVIHSFNKNTNSLQSDTSTLLNNDGLQNVERLPTPSNSFGTTDNFRIRLPLTQPRDETYSKTNNVSLTTACNTETLASNTSTDQKPKKEELENNVSPEPEIIDVDEWFNSAITSAEIIDLDCYFLDDEIKNEESNNVPKETSNVNSMDMNPRIGSVDSGIAESPNQVEHPDVLITGERLCVCTKIAELMCPCGIAIYCSTDCQTADWSIHKLQCVRRLDIS